MGAGTWRSGASEIGWRRIGAGKAGAPREPEAVGLVWLRLSAARRARAAAVLPHRVLHPLHAAALQHRGRRSYTGREWQFCCRRDESATQLHAWIGMPPDR